MRSSSVRRPWAFGVLTFSVIAVAIPVYLGPGPVPQDMNATVESQQASVTRHGAQAIRRSVNEGVADLVELASVFEIIGLDDLDTVQRINARFTGIHARYQTLYVLGPDGKILTAERGQPRPDLLRGDRPFRRADMDGATKAEEDLIIPQYSPISLCNSPTGTVRVGPCGRTASVVAHYDPGFLLNPIGGLEIGRSWLVDREGRVLATPGVAGGLQPLPRPDLATAARRAAGGEAGVYSTRVEGERVEVVAYAPVSGFGAAGNLGWSVITSRIVTDRTAVDQRQEEVAFGFALLLGTLTLLVFAWLWYWVIRPLDHLEHEADRVAHGQLDAPVRIVRHDEIGLVARSVDRLREQLRPRTDEPPAPPAG
jgi:HAMP domain-containing protein